MVRLPSANISVKALSEQASDTGEKTSLNAAIARIHVLTSLLEHEHAPDLVRSASGPPGSFDKAGINFLAAMLNIGAAQDDVVAVTGVIGTQDARAIIVLSSNSAGPTSKSINLSRCASLRWLAGT
jgi:hypothetical protein